MLCANYHDIPLEKKDVLMPRQKTMRRPTVSTVTPLSFDYFGELVLWSITWVYCLFCKKVCIIKTFIVQVY